MKTLHLTLKKKWFDMILSGEKKEEYRELSDYWCKRFCFKNSTGFDIEYDLNWRKILEYETITFTNGYGKNKPQIVIELKSTHIRKGKGEWGAPNYKTFVFFLGEILETKNIK